MYCTRIVSYSTSEKHGSQLSWNGDGLQQIITTHEHYPKSYYKLIPVMTNPPEQGKYCTRTPNVLAGGKERLRRTQVRSETGDLLHAQLHSREVSDEEGRLRCKGRQDQSAIGVAAVVPCKYGGA